jgi:hypothetical protein
MAKAVERRTAADGYNISYRRNDGGSLIDADISTSLYHRLKIPDRRYMLR